MQGTGGMITVAGGKLTTYRSMAREVVERAVRELRFRDGRPRNAEAETDIEPLPGGEAADLATFRERCVEIGMDTDTVEHLLRHYGTESAGICNLAARDRGLLHRLSPTHPAIEAEVIHAARRELAQRVEDVLVRRTHLYYEDPGRGAGVAGRVAELMGDGRRRRCLRREENARDERALLPVSIFEIGAVEILNKGTLYRFERDAKGMWFYHGIHAEAQAQHEHTVDPAAAERIEKAMIGFGRARKERDFPLNAQADEFGVTRPEIFIMAFPPQSTQPLSRYAVGIVAPDKLSRYVLPVGSTTVVTIADYHIDNTCSS